MIPSAVAVDALIAHLRNRLSASVATVNSFRPPEFVAPKQGPYTFTTGAWYLGAGQFSFVEEPDIAVDASDWWELLVLTSSVTLTAQQLAASLFPVQNIGATTVVADGGRLVIKSNTTANTWLAGEPIITTEPTAKMVNSVLGFPGGDVLGAYNPIIAPSYEGVCDGFPLLVPDMGSGFWVIVGDREAVPDDGSSLRRDSWTVRTSLHIMRPSYANERHRTREPISACLDAVRRCLLTDEGRQLGKAATGEIQIVEITSERVGGTALRFEEMQNVLFDTASLDVAIRVYQRPSST